LKGERSRNEGRSKTEGEQKNEILKEMLNEKEAN
jgi:hypothetical protein